MPTVSGLQRRKIIGSAGRSSSCKYLAWAVGSVILIQGFSSIAWGLSFKESLENRFLDEACCPRPNFPQGIWAWQRFLETGTLSPWYRCRMWHVITQPNSAPTRLLLSSPAVFCSWHSMAYETINQLSRLFVASSSVHRTLSEKSQAGCTGIAYINTDTHLPSGKENRGWPLLSWLNLSRYYLILQLAQLHPDSKLSHLSLIQGCS